MSNPDYVIELSSEESGSENDVEILEFKKVSQDLIDHPQQSAQLSKQLTDVQCPICLDQVDIATVASCGHIFCLECIQQSIASSHARGQVKGRRGIGLCPLCRKRVSFKDTIVLRLKVATKADPPVLPPTEDDEQKVDIESFGTK
ncbi:uncharacterized protein PRCAT00000188001 [Priceomyces carsonii]|uniref:uncharacterized protein n=1 Tax=Priceomyces carsonii TaxID=28549 RepID=UPI002ED9D7BF|nr:unnamed protein product [Priceomyces carsonii]